MAFYDQSRMEKLCRTCLRIPLELFPLLEDDKLSMMIKTISNIQVSCIFEIALKLTRV